MVALFFAVDIIIFKLIFIGLLKYYGFESNSQVLINGSSMSMSGFDRREIEAVTKFRTAFYAREGVNVEDRFVMLQHYFSDHPNEVKRVIYEVNPLLLTKISSSQNVHTLFYPFIDNQFIDSYIRKSENEIDYYIHRLIRCSRFDAQLLVTSIRGYLSNYAVYKTNTIDPLELSQLRSITKKATIPLDHERIKVFELSMELIKENSAKTILIVMPMVEEKNQSYDERDYSEYYNYFKKYAEVNDIMFVDFNLMEISNDSSLFSDPVHLNGKGQKKITAMLNSLLLK